MGDTDYLPCTQKQFEALVAEFGSNTTAEVLCASLATPDFDIPGIKYGLNSAWIVICGAMVFIMIIGVIVIAAWVCTLMGIFFSILKYFGMLRISHDEELMGLDASKHGAANDDDMGGRQLRAKPVPIVESVAVVPRGYNETSSFKNPSFV
eukprot:gene11903-15001_t